TGGYIIGYILGAGAVGLVIKKAGRSYKAIALALICGWFAVYIPGLLWITRVLEMGFAQALPAFVLPYLPGDIGKMLLSAWLIKRLYPIVK
ncbi:MAG: biotin transporter BioY, partial [Clostridiales bacterium]|nr:biotin transporter BioY [Clostridiales bacterium]